jgi:hypothetical protein
VDHPSTEVERSNGAGTTLPDSAPPCPLNDLPADVHQYIHTLQQRIEKLEAEQLRFTNALKKAGEFIFNSPQGKMISMAFPKEMQDGLRGYFNGNT